VAGVAARRGVTHGGQRAGECGGVLFDQTEPRLGHVPVVTIDDLQAAAHPPAEDGHADLVVAVAEPSLYLVTAGAIVLVALPRGYVPLCLFAPDLREQAE